VTTPVRFVLASASPARRALLNAAGVARLETLVSGVDESTVTGSPAQIAVTLAEQKALAVADRLSPALEVTLVLGCDSVLELDGEAHGKPEGAAQATARWQQMRGREGTLHTGHSLIRLDPLPERAEPSGASDADASDAGAARVTRLSSATVRFGDPSDDDVAAYVASGEPMAVAGAFTLDRLGGWFVDGIDGDPGTVLGVSLPLLRDMSEQLGVPVPALWA
jgi:septum formation protein